MHTQPQQPPHHLPALTPLHSSLRAVTLPLPPLTLPPVPWPLPPGTHSLHPANWRAGTLRISFIFVSNPSSFVSTTSYACFCPTLLATFPNWLSFCHCPLTFPCFFLFSHYLHVRYVERQDIQEWVWRAECDATGRPTTMVFTGWRDGASSMVGGL